MVACKSMSDRAPRRLALALASGTALLLVGGWFAWREDACVRLVEHASTYADAEIRRDSAGACYVCRRDGWLYDIAFPYCGGPDRPYSGFRIP